MDTIEKSEVSPKLPTRPADGPPESPTTARALDFDSDQDNDHTTPRTTESIPKPPPKDVTAPTRPPQALSPREQSELTLREAFPTVDASVVKAVLIASGGSVEPAFNALLAMTDPSAAKKEVPPPKPPRPVSARQISSTSQDQLDADEMYARQLQEHYAGVGGQQRSSTGRRYQDTNPNQYNEHLQPSRTAQGRPGAHPNPDNVHWRSFFDDDLPKIRDTVQQGFLETQNTVNTWLSSFKKTLDGPDADDDVPPPQPPRPNQRQNYGVAPEYNRRSAETARRSAEMQKYDADPQLIGDDFSRLGLRDGDPPPRTSSRPLANPNLFRANSTTSASGRKSPGGIRKVTFQDARPEEINDMYSGPNKPKAGDAPPVAPKPSKWQPMSVVAPSPVTENDPFSLGDSDDDKDAKPIMLKDVEADDVPKAAPSKPTTTAGVDTKSSTMN